MYFCLVPDLEYKILIVRLSSIGDIVLTTPIIRCVKQQLKAEVHVLIKKNFAQVLANNPYIDQVKYFENDMNACIAELKKEGYTHIVDLHNNIRSYRIKKALGILSFSFPKLNIQKWLRVNLKIDVLPKVHIVDRYFEACQSLNVKNDHKGLDYFPSEKDFMVVQTLPSYFLSGYVVFVCGAMHETKRFPVSKFIEVANQSKHPVVLIGGKEDRALAESIVEKSETQVFNACGRTSISESAVLISKAKAVLTNDTGMMHIAAAFNKPIVSVWGNTIPEFGMYPYLLDENKNSFISEVKLSCRPCSKIGHSQCPKGHFNCMQLQNSMEIAEKLNTFSTASQKEL
ncbi:MAG TPA: glycosyltransferase family 9 protein [Bacteroidia bacterium]|nr:glycosyltransferase family 9 protein [Bacteroidia bacterium]HNT79125.1 glycosyltransferase family 9 protein [Bacteroidia bacterium]